MSRRVCFVINQLGGVGSGGSDRVVSLLANGLSMRGWSVDICALTDERSLGRELLEDVNLRFLAKIGWRSRMGRVAARVLWGIRLIAAYRREYPDAVLVSFVAWVNICTCIGSKGRSRGLVFSERTDPAREPGLFVTRLLRDLCYRRAYRLVFQTPDALSYFGGEIAARGRVIGNPVSSGLPRWNARRDAPSVVAASRLEEQKNIPLLLLAFARFRQSHPQYRLVILGEGKQRGEIEALAVSLNIRDHVDLPGHVADVHDRMSAGSMFVLSSDYEGLPNSLLEAMAIGMPVISTDCPVGGPRLLVEDGVSGLLVPVGDAEGLSDALCRVAADSELARDLGRAAAGVRSSYDADQIVSEWERLLVQVAEEGAVSV